MRTSLEKFLNKDRLFRIFIFEQHFFHGRVSMHFHRKKEQSVFIAAIILDWSLIILVGMIFLQNFCISGIRTAFYEQFQFFWPIFLSRTVFENWNRVNLNVGVYSTGTSEWNNKFAIREKQHRPTSLKEFRNKDSHF